LGHQPLTFDHSSNLSAQRMVGKKGISQFGRRQRESRSRGTAMKKQRMTLKLSRPARWLRGQWPDRNPLRRGTDRAEAAITALTLITFLVIGPLSAILAAGWTVAAARNAGAGHHHQEPAVLLTSASPVIGGIFGGMVQPYARARWSGPGRAVHTGEVPVPPHTTAGSTVTIWTDASGRLAKPPAGPQQRVAGATLAAVLAVLGTGLLLLCGHQLTRSVLDRRRMAAWDRDWRSAGPMWSGRR
jgi:hypothetical protein